ncbi:MAG: TonB-dependent receptor, partial [Bacteroidota bacterium]
NKNILNGFRNNPAIISKNSYGFFNPKVGLTYFKNNFTAYASYSIANKEPNRDDFEAGILQQPKPERLNDLEIGVENKKAKWNWAVNLYYMQYKNQLVLTGMINDVGAYTRTNIPRSYRVGIEVQGGVAINRWLTASANIAFSKNKIKNFTEYIDDYDNGGQKTNRYNESDIAFSPAVVSAFTITMLPIKQLSIDLSGKYVGKQYLDNTANDNRTLHAFYTQDAKAIYSFGNRALKNVSLIFGVNNLFNKKYEPNGYTFSYYYNNALTTENFYFPMAGRTWVAGVQVKI